MRMLNFLVKLQQHDAATFWESVPAVLGLKSGDSGEQAWEAIQSQRVIADMIDDVRREVSEAPFNDQQRAFYLRDLTGLANALSPTHLGLPAAQAKQRITDVLKSRLEYLHMHLVGHVQETELSDDDVAPLLKAVQEALAVISQSELPEKLKDFVCKHLLNIKAAIEQYRFRGMVGVEEALAAYYGSLGIAHSAIDKGIDGNKKLKLTKVLETGKTLIDLAHSSSWIWPHALSAGQEIARLLGI